MTSTFVDKMLRSGKLQSHIKDILVPTYRRRYYTLMAAVKDLLAPLGVQVEVNRPKDATTATAGGFFTYLRLPDDLPAARTVAAVALKEKKLRIAFGHMFTVTGDDESIQRAEAEDGFSKCVRLCWAWHEEDEIREGVQRLADTILEARKIIKSGGDFGPLAIGIR